MLAVSICFKIIDKKTSIKHVIEIRCSVRGKEDEVAKRQPGDVLFFTSCELLLTLQHLHINLLQWQIDGKKKKDLELLDNEVKLTYLT